MIRWSLVLPVMIAAVLVQTAVFDVALVAGEVRIDLPLYLLVAIGLSTETTQAAVIGFVLGLFVDLFQFGPFGLHALIYCFAGWTLAEARLRVLHDGIGLRSMQGLWWALVVTGLTWMLGSVFGQQPAALRHGPWGVVATLGVIGVVGSIAVHPMGRVISWTMQQPWQGREKPLTGI